jgi:hypothetical protein
MHSYLKSLNHKKQILPKLLLTVIFMAGSYLFAQQGGCKVLVQNLSGTYQGGCRKGLASGDGVAQGIDRYEGKFVRGLPDGKGRYTWAGGEIYEGEWKNGFREGRGKMVYRDSVVNGYWSNDKYLGKTLIPPYRIISSMSVSRATIMKTIGTIDGVMIRIMRGGTDNPAIEDFTLAYDSGTEYRNGNYYGIENTSFPLTVKVKYSAWNQFMTSKFNVIFEFVINARGTWDVVIIN